MKHIILTLSFSLFIASISSLSINAEEHNNPEVIVKYEDDISGDGLKEIIELKGIRLLGNADYYHNVWADITNHLGEKTKINYQGGYKPNLQLIDLNNDNIKDVFYQSISDLEKNTQLNYLHTFKGGKVNEITLPDPIKVSGELVEQFKIKLSTPFMTKPNYVNLGKHSKKYVENGIYDNKGQLLKKQSTLLVARINIEPILINAKNGHALKTNQAIFEPLHNDYIGAIETLWYLEDDRWKNLQTEFTKSN